MCRLHIALFLLLLEHILIVKYFLLCEIIDIIKLILIIFSLFSCVIYWHLIFIIQCLVKWGTVSFLVLWLSIHLYVYWLQFIVHIHISNHIDIIWLHSHSLIMTSLWFNAWYLRQSDVLTWFDHSGFLLTITVLVLHNNNI